MSETEKKSTDDLRSIALYQKGILVCLLCYLGAIAGQFAVPQEMKLALSALAILVILASTVFVFLLATKVMGTGLGILMRLLTLIPCIGLIILLVINSKATSTLKANGIAVGLLGASLSDIK